jgi:hypothetical protein
MWAEAGNSAETLKVEFVDLGRDLSFDPIFIAGQQQVLDVILDEEDGQFAR